MKTLNSAWSAGLIVMAACGAQGEPPMSATQPERQSDAEFVVDLWPGEGIPVIQMRRDGLVLRAQPDLSAPVVDTLRGRVGQRVAFDSTRFVTLQPGAFRFTRNGSITGRDLGRVRHLSRELYYRGGQPEISIPVTTASAVEFLQYRAEGTCFVRLDGRVIDAHPCPGFGKDSVEVVREPVTLWWIQALGARGRSGWLIVSDSTAQSVRREF